MASDTKRITVRIPVEMSEELERLVEKGDYSSISETIRAAIDEFIKNKNAPDHISKVTVDLPKKKVSEIEDLVQEGDSVNVDDAIRTAVREYVKERIKQYKKKLEE
ncbi:MAG: ribbon-helix-helix domain-containing protein [Thermoplasmata archaeon]